MPIFIKRFAEPLCAPPFDPPDGPAVASSLARDTLRRVMLNYCERTIGGRSILIAGHRGAGKTTLVKSVVEELTHDRLLKLDAKPLFVYLHGPDIVEGEDVLGVDEQKAESEQKSSSPSTVIYCGNASAPNGPQTQANSTGAAPEQSAQERKRVAQIALRHLTVALQQAIGTHVGWSMQSAAGPNHAEIATQFRLDLDRQIENSELRWYWDKAGVLHQGVLDRAPGKRYKSYQGMLEIVALASVNDAYTRATAKDIEESEGEVLEAKLELKQERLEDRKQLINSVAGLLSGGIAGVGAATSASGSAKAALGAFAFIAASVITTAVLNLFSVRTFSQKRSKEKKVIYNESLGSLELMVPLLIHRIQDAGLAPIFVVDELDKVEDLEVKMDVLFRQLKHLVADKAFCCFLVDRTYFDKVRSWNAAAEQSRGLTYFGEQLYVIVRPQEWHAYLQRLLEVSGEDVNDRFAALVLRYVLLARSRMHAIDLRRELERLPRKRGTEDELDIRSSRVLSRAGYLNLFHYQVAVEYLLQDPNLAQHLEENPYHLQLAYDALYYLLRKWEQADDPVWTPQALLTYLQARMRTKAA
ncbi:MAG TPA: hypothetical protein VH302_02460 [Bryobacteraceae bacterium]|nr:hypothetical protein [Bryobacteraceae bacterium]